MEPLVGDAVTDYHWLQGPEATGDVGRRTLHTPQRENPSKMNSTPLPCEVISAPELSLVSSRERWRRQTALQNQVAPLYSSLFSQV